MTEPTTIDELQLYLDLCALERQDRQRILNDMNKHLNPNRSGSTETPRDTTDGQV